MERILNIGLPVLVYLMAIFTLNISWFIAALMTITLAAYVYIQIREKENKEPSGSYFRYQNDTGEIEVTDSENKVYETNRFCFEAVRIEGRLNYVSVVNKKTKEEIFIDNIDYFFERDFKSEEYYNDMKPFIQHLKKEEWLK